MQKNILRSLAKKLVVSFFIYSPLGISEGASEGTSDGVSEG